MADRKDPIALLETAYDNMLESRNSGGDQKERLIIDAEEKVLKAIDLLQTQGPKVMTLEEVLATEVVYAEDIDKAEIIPVLVSRRAHDRIVLVRAHLMGGPSHVIYPLICEYGKRWRCWTSRPTDAQREATPWAKT